MSVLSRIRTWWRAVFHGTRIGSEVEQELQFHIDTYADDLVRRGMPPEEAVRQARVELGQVGVQKEKYREAIGLRLFDEIGSDVRYGVRSLWKNPGFSAVAILSLALGIGATTAMFSLIYAVLLHPFPYANSGRIMNPELINEDHPEIYTWFAMTKSQFETLSHAKSIQSLLGFTTLSLEITGDHLPEDVRAIYLTENASTFFGVPAMLGRGIQPSDAARGSSQSNIAVLNYEFWQRHYDGNKNVLGKALQLDHKDYTIVGVMPRSFAFNDTTGTGDVYLPRSLLRDSVSPPIAWPWTPWIKLKPGVSLQAADAELQAFVQQFKKENPQHYPKRFRVQLQPIIAPYEQSSGHTLSLLFASVVLLLAIGCANCSILLLARGNARRHELALRSAIGASRWRIVRQLIVESILVSFAGAALGVALSFWLAKLPLLLSPASFPNESYIRMSLPILGFSVGLAMLTGLTFGLAPSLRLSQPDISQMMQSSLRRIGGQRDGHSLLLLIGGQIALTLVLMSAAGTAIGAFMRLQHMRLGYDPHHVMQVGIVMHWNDPAEWDNIKTEQGRAAFIEQVRKKIASIPGVLSAAVGTDSTPPYSGVEHTFKISSNVSEQEPEARIHRITPNYFSTLAIPLLQGRLWDRVENLRGDSVAIVNQTLAHRYWPNGNAIGQQIRVPDLKAYTPLVAASSDSGGWRQVIGVVGNARNDGLGNPVLPAIYLPYTTMMEPYAQFEIRTQGKPLSFLHSVRAAVQSVSSDQQISNGTYDLEEALQRDPTWSRQRLFSILFGFFSGMALVLALVGLYSVVAFAVVQRTSEFGVRMALGAQRRHILWLVVRATIIALGGGITVGLILSIALQKLLTRWVAGSVHDPLILTGVTLLLILCAVIACLVPARRAATIDPMQTLRCE